MQSWAGAQGHLDPELVAAFQADAEQLLSLLNVVDLLASVIAAEPGEPVIVGPGELDGLCLGPSIVGDLKGLFLLGHSAHVAALADQAGTLAGLPPQERAALRAAALLHDLGRAAVPSGPSAI